MTRLICVILTSLLLPLAAQQEGRAIRIRTLCFQIAPGERELTVSGDPNLASTAKVRLSRRLSSEQQKLLIQGKQLVLGIPGTDENQRPVIRAVARATIPATGSQFLLLLVPNGKKEGVVYRCMVLSDDKRDFPMGGFRLINLSPKPLRIAMGKQRVELAPGKIKTVDKIDGVREDGRFTYVAQYQDGKTWNRLSTGYWMQREKVRSVQIVYLDPRSKRLTMRGYDDTLSSTPD